jgi:hypothetical protein
MTESEKLWRIWWLWGIPTAWIASALILVAENARVAGYHGWGDVLDVARLAVYWYWMRLAWQRAGNVDNRFWTPLARIALAAGLAINALV